MLIREALIKDLPVVMHLLKELDRDAAFDSAESLLICWHQMERYPFYKCYVIEDDIQITGTFCLLICDNLGHGGMKFAIVDNVVVHPEHQGKGIGKCLMDEAMRISQKNGCYKLMLSSNIRREDAHRFYEKLGFQRHGVSFMIDLGSEIIEKSEVASHN